MKKQTDIQTLKYSDQGKAQLIDFAAAKRLLEVKRFNEKKQIVKVVFRGDTPPEAA